MEATDTTTRPETMGAADWHQSRRLPVWGEFPTTPVAGFGPKGDITLYVPSPKVEAGYKFVDGEPTRSVDPSPLMRDEELVELRDEVMASLQPDLGFGPNGGPLVSVDVKFLRYVAAVLRKVYTLSDGDLTYLLSGTKWQRDMVAHLCGGPDVLERMATPAAEGVLERAYPDVARQRAEGDRNVNAAFDALNAAEPTAGGLDAPRWRPWLSRGQIIWMAVAVFLIIFMAGVAVGMRIAR